MNTPKISVKLLIGILILVTISLLMISLLHQAGVKEQYQYCTSIAESKKKKLYIATYLPNKTTIALKLREGAVLPDTAWAEYAWYIKANTFISSLERGSDKGYNLVLKLKPGSFKKFVYSFDFRHKALGQAGGFNIINHQYEGTVYFLPDTLRVFLEEKNLAPGVGWRKPIITDTLLYIKKINP